MKPLVDYGKGPAQAHACLHYSHWLRQQMHNPIHRTPGFYFAIEKPCSDTEEKSDNDVLRKNSPSEWNQHYEEFIKRPEPDQLGIVEVSWD